MKKKAQVTLFILIGLIILVLAGIGGYFYYQQKEMPEDEVRLERVPPEQRELYNYVQNCIRLATLEGLEIQRLQGGYIWIPENAEYLLVEDPEDKVVKYVDGRLKVVIDPSGVNKVPYWLTEKQIIVPSLYFLETELAQYVAEEVDACVASLQPFVEKGFAVKRGEVETKVYFHHAVNVEVNLPITLTENISGRIIEREDFGYSVPIDMGLIYRMARDITQRENRYAQLEFFTTQLINLYGQINNDWPWLPPTSKSSPDCSEVTWSKQEVESRLKDIIRHNIKYLRVSNTDYINYTQNMPQSTGDEKRQVGAIDGFIYDWNFNQDYSDVRVKFDYDPDQWDFFNFDVRGGSSDERTVRPSKASSDLLGFLDICSYRYKFKYDLQYPMLVSINHHQSAKIDPQGDTFKEKANYTFYFPLWLAIYGNQWRTYRPRTDVNQSGQDLIETMFCDSDQKKSGVFDVSVRDAWNNTPVEAANLIYYCGPQTNCFIDITDDNGTVSSRFPFCLNGLFYIQREDYLDYWQKLTVDSFDNKDLDIDIWPLKSLNTTLVMVNAGEYVKQIYYSNFTNYTVSDLWRTIKPDIGETTLINFDLVPKGAPGLSIAFPKHTADYSNASVGDMGDVTGMQRFNIPWATGSVDYTPPFGYVDERTFGPGSYVFSYSTTRDLNALKHCEEEDDEEYCIDGKFIPQYPRDSLDTLKWDIPFNGTFYDAEAVVFILFANEGVVPGIKWPNIQTEKILQDDGSLVLEFRVDADELYNNSYVTIVAQERPGMFPLPDWEPSWYDIRVSIPRAEYNDYITPILI